MSTFDNSILFQNKIFEEEEEEEINDEETKHIKNEKIYDNDAFEEEEEEENEIHNNEEEEEEVDAEKSDIISPTQCMHEKDEFGNEIEDSHEGFEVLIQPLNFESSNFADSEFEKIKNLDKIMNQPDEKPPKYHKIQSPSSIIRKNSSKGRINGDSSSKKPNMTFNFSNVDDESEYEMKKTNLPPKYDLLSADGLDDDEEPGIFMPSDFLNDLQLSICLSHQLCSFCF